MERKEKELVLQFMRLVMFRLEPRISELPLEHMQSVEWSKGDHFNGTEYEFSPLQDIYCIWKTINRLEQL